MTRKKLAIFSCLSFILIIGVFWSSYRNAVNKPVVPNTFNLEINKGDSFDHITAKLKQAVWILNRIGSS